MCNLTRNATTDLMFGMQEMVQKRRISAITEHRFSLTFGIVAEELQDSLNVKGPYLLKTLP